MKYAVQVSDTRVLNKVPEAGNKNFYRRNSMLLLNHFFHAKNAKTQS